MKRGKYKQYSSIDKMPKSTRYDLARKLKVQESEELKKINNQNLDSFIQPKNPQQQEQENMIEPTETIVNNLNESNKIETDTLIYSNQLGDDEDFEEDPEDDLNEITKMTKEELAAAYLASFYSGNKTQSSL
jgi:hypothetical protein